jgi:hypothetical protein
VIRLDENVFGSLDIEEDIYIDIDIDIDIGCV